MHSRILGREVARARLHLADELPPVRSVAVTTAPGANVREPNLEPVPLRRVVSEQDQPAADRVDGDVEVAVVVVVGRREAASVHRGVRASHGALTGAKRGCLPGPDVLEDLHAPGVLREVQDGDRAVREDEVEIAVEVEVGPGVPHPSSRVPTAAANSGRASANDGRRPPETPVGGVQLIARVVTKRSVRPSPLVVGRRRCPCPRSGRRRPRVSRRPRGSRNLRRRRPSGDVLVELVRVGVVRDVQVETPVAVDVREDAPSPCADLRPLDTRRLARPRGTSNARSRPCPRSGRGDRGRGAWSDGKPDAGSTTKFGSVYDETKRSGRPSPLTSPTAAAECQPCR